VPALLPQAGVRAGRRGHVRRGPAGARQIDAVCLQCQSSLAVCDNGCTKDNIRCFGPWTGSRSTRSTSRRRGSASRWSR
jgi:hypothetical protein